MSTKLKHYENTAVLEAAALLIGDDAITYSVLGNILHGDSRGHGLLLSDLLCCLLSIFAHTRCWR